MVQRKIHPPPPPTTPRLAPWDHVEALCNKLDRLIAILEGAAPAPPPEWPGWEPVISKLDEIKSALKELKIIAVTTWEAGPIQEILAPTQVRVAGSTNTEILNWQKGKRLLVKVTSTLDQPTIVQIIGNIDNSIDGAVNIGAALPCAAFSHISIGLAWDDWHPYVGAILTHALTPTQGSIKVEAVIQE